MLVNDVQDSPRAAPDNDRVDLRDRPAPHEGHQGSRLEGGRAGARFEAGKLVERPDGQPVDAAA